MYKIIIKAENNANYPFLEELDGISCEDDFSEYIDRRDVGVAAQKAITSGFMDFRFEDGKLWTYTTYVSKIELTDTELEKLLEYTIGQWSDGIGEGFEQEPCAYIENQEVYLSPWYFGQRQIIEQIVL